MKKIKAEIIAAISYEINPEFYPEGSTPDECLKIDVDNFKESPEDILLFNNILVSGRIIEDIKEKYSEEG